MSGRNPYDEKRKNTQSTGALVSDTTYGWELAADEVTDGSEDAVERLKQEVRRLRSERRALERALRIIRQPRS